MGSLSPKTQSPSRSQDNSSNQQYRVYASFSSKEANPNTDAGNWMECYEPTTNSWHKITRIPGIENHFLKRFGMVALGDSIYIIGGRLCHKVKRQESSDKTVEVNLEVVPSVLRYNVQSGTWSKCAPLQTPRFNFACAVNNGKIYVAGGQVIMGSSKGISSAEIYDPDTDEWKYLPSLNTMRYKSAGVTWKNNVYVIGGFTNKDGCDSPGPFMIERSSAEMYDPQSAMWKLVPRMWELDIPPNQIVPINGKLFSSGDCFRAWKGHIESYDSDQNIWNVVDGSYYGTTFSLVSMADASLANWPDYEQVYLTMAPVGTRLFFLGGYRKPGECSKLWSIVNVFETSGLGDSWRSLEPVEEDGGGEKELCCHCCVLEHAS